MSGRRAPRRRVGRTTEGERRESSRDAPGSVSTLLLWFSSGKGQFEQSQAGGTSHSQTRRRPKGTTNRERHILQQFVYWLDFQHDIATCDKNRQATMELRDTPAAILLRLRSCG
jgi:hypothetical protein